VANQQYQVGVAVALFRSHDRRCVLLPRKIVHAYGDKARLTTWARLLRFPFPQYCGVFADFWPEWSST
jgi:hypothetical protein